MRTFPGRYIWLLVAVVVFSATYLLDNQSTREAYNKYLVKEFQEKLFAAHEKVAAESERILDLAGESRALLYTDENLHRFHELKEEQGISFYLLKNGKPYLWTDNGMPKVQSVINSITEGMVARLGNGWYEVSHLAKGPYVLYTFHLIKHDYERQNEFLKDRFHKKFGISDQFDFDFTASEDAYPVYDEEGHYLFSLKRVKDNYFNGILAWIFSLLYGCSILLFLVAISFIFNQLSRSISVYFIAVNLVVFLLVRYLLLLATPHMIWAQSEVFSPLLYATSEWVPSLADLLIWCLFICGFVYFWSKTARRFTAPAATHIFVLRAIFMACIGFIASVVMESLIQDSNINLDLSKIYKLDLYSYMAIFSIGLLFVAFFQLADLSLDPSKYKYDKPYNLLGIYVVIQLLLALGFSLDMNIYWQGLLWVFPSALLITISKSKHRQYRFAYVLGLILIFSGLTAWSLQHLQTEHEKKERFRISEKLAEQDDPVANYLFGKLCASIKQDQAIKDSIADYWSNWGFIDQHIKTKYLSGYWTKYEATITACAESDSVVVTPDASPLHCKSFFLSQLPSEQLFTGDGFYDVAESFGRKKFLGVCRIPTENNEQDIWLFFEFYSKIIPRGEGYPELLLDDKEISQLIRLDDYAYAIYDNGQLLSSSGKYDYPLDRSGWLDPNDSILEEAQFDHVVSGDPQNISVVVSKEKPGTVEHFATFSYLFVIFCIMFLLFSILLPGFPVRYRLAFSHFDARVQTFLVMMILLSCVLFGIGSVYYFKKNYHEKNEHHLGEKVRSVLIELEQKLGGTRKITTDMEESVMFYLVKFSNVFYTDINLYDTDGNMIASSRDEVFDIGLTGNRMDIHAFNALKVEQLTEYIHDEEVGDLSYLSAYVPFVNENNELLGYLNLPYFARQNELETEISSLLVALINIYVMLFVLSILIAVIFSNYISRPIRLIGQRMGQIQLGGSNELISWEGNDEIGRLVKEYNRMVVELSESVAKLAQSERESAWREMAKQVAHEIKNPLTPMKLSIQHLKRAAEDNAPDLEERINKTAQTLIYQIETLSHIATEFSDFAKMPSARQEKIHLGPIITQVADLFMEGKEEEAVKVKIQTAQDVVMADKDQMIRVLNNLIKNAFQAKDEAREPRVEVNLSKAGKCVLIEVKDNGKGIADDQKERIFQPNFTTKSSGTGLGLAMVKSMVENAGGKVWFESVVGQGTSFYVELPALED